MKVNLNVLAREIALEEGNKVNLPIAQVKEVMKIFIKKLKGMTLEEVVELMSRK